jgi:hypothetical protein
MDGFGGEELMNDDAAAQAIGVAPVTLRAWRHRKVGPAYFKVGRLVYYRPSDLWAWFQGQRRDPQAS